jgi:hypothetical protein
MVRQQYLPWHMATALTLRLVWTLVATIVCTIGLAMSQTMQRSDSMPPNRERTMTQLDDAEARGKELRAVLDELYAALPLWRKPRFNVVPPTPAKDISDVIKRYIPPGVTFDDAENVLRSAGFRIVRPRKTELLPTPENVLPAYDVSAELPMTAERPAELMGVRVILRPRVILDYEVVHEVWGRIEKKEDR